MKKIFPIVLFLYSIFLFFVPPVHAQSTTLSITPPVVEILIAPGKKLIQNFTFKADGDNLSVIPEIHHAKPIDSNGHITIDPDPYTPSSISLSITSNHELGKAIPLKNGELTMSLTLDAATVDMAEDVYLALVLKVVSNDVLNSSTSTLPAISALIFTTINPSGVTPIDLSIENFTPPLFHDSYQPFTISPLLKNNIPIMLRPSGSYEVIDSRGQVVYHTPLYPSLILGESTRQIMGMKDDLQLPLTWVPRWHNIGPYRLRITITTQGGTKIIEVEKPIWIMPIRGIILILLALILCLIIFLQMKRRNTS